MPAPTPVPPPPLMPAPGAPTFLPWPQAPGQHGPPNPPPGSGPRRVCPGATSPLAPTGLSLRKRSQTTGSLAPFTFPPGSSLNVSFSRSPSFVTYSQVFPLTGTSGDQGASVEGICSSLKSTSEPTCQFPGDVLKLFTVDSTCITMNRIGCGRLKECFPPSPFQPLTPVSHHEHVYFLSSKTYQNAHPIFISAFPNRNPRLSQGPDPTCRSLSRLQTGLFSPPGRVSAQVTPVPAFTPTVLHSPPPL